MVIIVTEKSPVRFWFGGSSFLFVFSYARPKTQGRTNSCVFDLLTQDSEVPLSF